MRKLTLTVFGILLTHVLLLAQRGSSDLANEFIHLSAEQNQQIQFKFNDPLRFEWRRTPGQRNGVALYQMNLQQKKILHEIMSLALSVAGYNKISHILFNEDLSQEIDPGTGQNKYWFAIYGEPSLSGKWGWKLEGHHLSINFTLQGNTLISASPFELGSYPATVEKDTVRAGFRNLSKEIDLSFELITSLNSAQLKKAVIANVKPTEKMLGELYTIPLKEPVGIPYRELTELQKSIVVKLVAEYTNSVNFTYTINFASFYFAWWGPIDKGTSALYAYRLHGKELLIDYENIGNHIHCVLRSLKNDFAENPYNN